MQRRRRRRRRKAKKKKTSKNENFGSEKMWRCRRRRRRYNRNTLYNIWRFSPTSNSHDPLLFCFFVYIFFLYLSLSLFPPLSFSTVVFPFAKVVGGLYAPFRYPICRYLCAVACVHRWETILNLFSASVAIFAYCFLSSVLLPIS